MLPFIYTPYLIGFFVYLNEIPVMRKSKFSTDDKLRILTEQEAEEMSIEEICVKYGISLPTFYSWKRELAFRSEMKSEGSNVQDLRNEIHTLRRLYIDLSEHNYQLAQFLNQ